MIVYRSRYAVRRYRRGGAGIVFSIGAMVAKYATRAMLTSAAKSALQVTLKTAQAALPAMIGHKIMTSIKWKNTISKSSRSEEPHSKKAAIGTTPNIKALRRFWNCFGLDMIGESILDIHAGNSSDESIKVYEYDYQPITGSQLNTAGQITITIENQDQFVHLHNSYLIVEGDVLNADNTRYADADMVALTNNGLMYLFSSFKLTLAGQEVEHVNSPGFASSLMGLASYSGDFNKGCGLSQCWYPDNGHTAAAVNTGFAVRQQFLVQKPNPKGSFQFDIPLRHIFGFMDDYTKVTYGMRDTLQMIRKDDNDALFRTKCTKALPQMLLYPSHLE